MVDSRRGLGMTALQRWLWGAVAGSLVLAVAGCSSSGGGSGGSGAATVPRAPTATASASVRSPYPSDVPLTGRNTMPGEKPPVYPEAARADTQTGANAFAEFFIQTLDWAYATTNPSYMKHYSGPSCGLCAGLVDGIAKTAGTEHWYVGGRLNVRSVDGVPIAPVTAPANYCSRVTVDVSATRVVDARNHVYNQQEPLTDQPFKLCAERHQKEWVTTYFNGMKS